MHVDVINTVLFHGIAHCSVSGDPVYVWWPPDDQSRTKCEVQDPIQYTRGNTTLDYNNSTFHGKAAGQPEVNHDLEKQSIVRFDALLGDPDKLKEEQATVKAQVVFGCYLARWAFRALEWII